MPTALSRPRVRADMQLALCGRPAHNRDRRQHEIPIALAASQCPISRDFVPWRFLDAGQLSLPSVSSLLVAQKTAQKRPFTRVAHFYGQTIKDKRPRGQYTTWPLRDCPPRPSRDSVSGRIVCGRRCLSRVSDGITHSSGERTRLNQPVRFKRRLQQVRS